MAAFNLVLYANYIFSDILTNVSNAQSEKLVFWACDNPPHREYLAAVESGNLKLAKKAALDEIKFLRSIQNGA